MLSQGKRQGLVLLLVGGIFLFNDIYHIPNMNIWTLWPLILVAVGISILLKRKGWEQTRRTYDFNEDYIDETSIFSGSEKVIQSQNFKGGRITCIFGGSEINLTQTKLSEGENVLDVFCLFGGNALIVPSDWKVILDGFMIFGGYSDKRKIMVNQDHDPKKTLRIKGFVMFGGGEIKSA
jgi:predicted membrane protein